LVAQPIHQVSENSIAGWELFTRLKPVDGKLLPPADFLPIAERLGLLEQVDLLVSKVAIGFVSEPNAPNLWINVSVLSARSEPFVKDLADRLHRVGKKTDALGIELVGVPGNAANVGEIAETLDGTGLPVAIHASGPADILRWQEIQPRVVKLDGGLCRRLATSTEARATFGACVDVAHASGCELAATRVPDWPAAELAIDLGADLLQGFPLGRPRPLVKLP
jgi:EAL domain-containing protein (putative c-di-GMP-specific phosphodiesterase class I)